MKTVSFTLRATCTAGGVLIAVASHHARFDGKGYPRGLRGEEIPLLDRITALVDACSAMLLTRPYRQGLSWPETAAELRCGAGTQCALPLWSPSSRRWRNPVWWPQISSRRSAVHRALA